MDDFLDDYQPDDNYNGPNLEPGDYKLKIKNILFGHAKTSGAPMMTVEVFVPSAPGIVFKHYIPKNDYFNANMTKMYDAFGIPRGNRQYDRWIGRMGKGHIEKGDVKDDGKSYLELKYLIVEKKPAPQVPGTPAVQQAYRAPASQPGYAQPAAQASRPVAEPFMDDIPF